MLRPKATRIALSRAEIRHLELGEGLPRYPPHGPVSIARLPEEPILSPSRDLHPVRDAGFRTRTPEPSNITAMSRSDEAPSTQNARLSTRGYHREQVLEIVVSYGGTQSIRRMLTVPWPARGLAETPRQNSKTSEDRSSPGGLAASARNLRIAEIVGSPGPNTESSSLGTNALHETNAQLLGQDVGYPEHPAPSMRHNC